MCGVSSNKDIIWAYLIHLGYNFWYENDSPRQEGFLNASRKLRFDKDVWDKLLVQMAGAGVNTVVIDLGEGIRYESHPELGAKGAWSVDQLRDELQKIRQLGLKPVPKLNFSACHDEWLGEYSRCLSTRVYYQVCADLINEVADIFDGPELFHLGMDEENYSNQMFNNYVVLRQGELWWHDLYFLVNAVEKKGARAWVWSDSAWDNKSDFLKKMPGSVLQSSWYYRGFTMDDPREKVWLDTFKFLDENGYDQVLAGSNCLTPANFSRLVEFGQSNLSAQTLKGYIQTVWEPTVAQRKYRHAEAVDLVRQAVSALNISKNSSSYGLGIE